MERVRSLASEYKHCNFLNMDEIALFWKLTPDRTLAKRQAVEERRAKTVSRLVQPVIPMGQRSSNPG
jgi:hypothetical protein